MKHILSALFLTTNLWLYVDLFPTVQPITLAQTNPQSQSDNNLFYLYNSQRIRLQVKADAIAVAFRSTSPSRAIPIGGESIPLYQQLQTDLQANIRGLTPPQVDPIGTNYALVTRKGGIQTPADNLEQRIQQQPYVQTTLPVLSGADGGNILILPNEIVLSFAADLTKAQQQAVLEQNNLELIRPLRFTQNRYLVRSRTATGTAVLAIANQLRQVRGVRSATPNFIQVTDPQMAVTATPPNNPTTNPFPNLPLANLLSQATRALPPYTSNLLSLQWYLNSTPLRSGKSRTDLRITDAWKHSQGGEGVVVAVLDSLIQWDHPSLINSLYQVGNVANKLPDEQHGWDFTNNDNDTRISDRELAILTPHFQRSFQLDDQALLQQYEALAEAVNSSKDTPATLAEKVRTVLRSEVIGNFHGTMVSGIIAAQSSNGNNMSGIAPKVKLLPVRVGTLGRGIADAAVLEAIPYAIQRGADIINLSFGGLYPTQETEEEIAIALQNHPNLIIVASAGNERLDRASFPAVVKGVVSVGAINLEGRRAPYSNFGTGIDVVAPGGDMSNQLQGGILTTNGVGIAAFWQGLAVPTNPWYPAQDAYGNYVWTEGTSFASPAVAGVLALMRGEDPNRRLSRDRLVAILKSTARYDSLQISSSDQDLYQFMQTKTKLATTTTPEQYFFGSGLVNAEAAIAAIQNQK